MRNHEFTRNFTNLKHYWNRSGSCLMRVENNKKIAKGNFKNNQPLRSTHPAAKAVPLSRGDFLKVLR